VYIADGPRGRGVFASRRIAAEEIVELCPTLVVEENAVDGLLKDYVFKHAEDDEAVVLILGFGMLYNHSSKPNLRHWQYDADTIAFETTRAVKRDEELTISYGKRWWRDRDLDPI
jgi:SET domain-containing protein